MSVRPTHAGIVSKRLNLSENFLVNLVAPLFQFIDSMRRADNQFQQEPRQQVRKIHAGGKILRF